MTVFYHFESSLSADWTDVVSTSASSADADVDDVPDTRRCSLQSQTTSTNTSELVILFTHFVYFIVVNVI